MVLPIYRYALCDVQENVFLGSVLKYSYYVKNSFWGASCRNITDHEPGVPGVSCRAIFGVREVILIFQRNVHLWL